jgi:hypothetical protein
VDEERMRQAPRRVRSAQQRLLRLKPREIFGNQFNITATLF